MPHPYLAIVMCIIWVQFSPVIVIKTMRAERSIVLKLYSDTSPPSSVLFSPYKNYLPINALMNTKIAMSRPKLAVSGTESTIVDIIAFKEGQMDISLKMRNNLNALKIDSDELDWGKKTSTIEITTIIPSKRCKTSVI